MFASGMMGEKSEARRWDTSPCWQLYKVELVLQPSEVICIAPPQYCLEPHSLPNPNSTFTPTWIEKALSALETIIIILIALKTVPSSGCDQRKF